MSKRIINCFVLIIVTWASYAAAQEVPAYLQDARAIVKNVKPDKNRYSSTLAYRWIKANGDDVDANTDCAGFVNFVFERQNNPSYNKVKEGVHWEIYVRTDNWYEAITKNIGFANVTRVQDVKPGDVIVFLTPPESAFNDRKGPQGHIMLVDVAPTEIKPIGVTLEGTKQWGVMVLDSNTAPHGPTDTRATGGSLTRDGLGRARFRIYTDEAGTILAVVAGKKYPLVVGHPIQ